MIKKKERGEGERQNNNKKKYIYIKAVSCGNEKIKKYKHKKMNGGP